MLDAVTSAEGILFDLPDVIGTLDGRDRLTARAGDFFVDPLPTADAYILMEVIHDWDDADAIAILSAVGAAASPGATILIIEAATANDQLDARVQTLDMIMLTITGGRERTSTHLTRLFDSAGLRAINVHQTPGTLHIVEATVV